MPMYEDTPPEYKDDFGATVRRKDAEEVINSNTTQTSNLRFKAQSYEAGVDVSKNITRESISVCPNCDRIMRITPKALHSHADVRTCIVCGVLCVEGTYRHDEQRTDNMLKRKPKDSFILLTCQECSYKSKIFISNLLHSGCPGCGSVNTIIEMINNHEKSRDGNSNNEIISIW